ncbi:MAG: rRNA maturation RNase YbeY [Anaerolineae bacterium]|nr:rRNA maturation RNase YbeY [Caldilineales bacterium]MCX7851747.1 rRNA maturation RNase YbeY [Caldilineales bacterium]MDW8268839.1 rRNA maturation RNase YbeY [Anaerolineae bacterium]
MITIRVLPEFESLVPTDRLEAAVAAVLAREGAEGDVTLVICDDATIADLNRRFLGEEGPTDVLSFPAQDKAETHFVVPSEMPPYLGDIVIAYPYAAAQARRLGRRVEDELELLAVHGTLHLLGYDHADPGGQRVMWARQEAILTDLARARSS